MTIIAYLFIFLILIVILFQIALALGAPWGEFAMGGRFPGRLPPRIRLLNVVQIVVLLFFIIVVLAKSQLAFPGLYPFSRVAIWFVFGFFILGTLMNIITPSKKERLIWAPVNAILLILSLLLALQ
jgi:hypothetical protein